ncbi:MAG: hypothetical protein Tsb0020_53400 [Haliangiales bacterium]
MLTEAEVALREVEADLVARDMRGDYSDVSYAAHRKLIERAVQLDHDLACVAAIALCRLRAAVELRRPVEEVIPALDHVLAIIPRHHPSHDLARRLALRGCPELRGRGYDDARI